MPTLVALGTSLSNPTTRAHFYTFHTHTATAPRLWKLALGARTFEIIRNCQFGARGARLQEISISSADKVGLCDVLNAAAAALVREISICLAVNIG